jgi:four helix bundle protein
MTVEEIRTSSLIKSFRDLEVYKRAFRSSMIIHRESLTFPKVEQFALAGQLRRSSQSICANIAEGFGRQKSSPQEFKRFLVIAIGSCNETQVWLDYCLEMNYLSVELSASLQEDYEIILKMLHSLHAKVK